MLWPYLQPFVWFLFFPAVFISTRIGGVVSGIASTVIAAALVVFVFIEHQLSFSVNNIQQLNSVALFVVMGVLFTVTHDRMRKSAKGTEEALDTARRANEKLTEAHQKVQQLYKKTHELDALKSKFFANVSHELRTPLSLILGPLGRLRSSPNMREDDKRALEMIDRNARTLSSHVTDLLDIAKVEAGRMDMRYSDADLAGIVRMAVDAFTGWAVDKGIQLTVTAPECMQAQIDKDKVRRILFNVLSNAMNFAPEGSAVLVRLSAQNRQAVLEVEDSGPGVPEDQRETIFERFRQGNGTAQRRHEGTGLGLAIVKDFAELHGGSVEVHGAPEGGALFRVLLPVQAPEGATVDSSSAIHEESVAPGPAFAPSRNRVQEPSDSAMEGEAGPLVLIVEDNADMRDYLAQVLGKVYRVAEAESGLQGVEKAIFLKPSAIITDIMMPEMDGEHMVNVLSQNEDVAHIPVLVLTAKSDDEIRIRMMQGSVRGVLAKPFQEEELMARVRDLLSEGLLNERRVREQHLWLGLVVEASRAGLWDWDIPSGRLQINERWAEIAGYTLQELEPFDIRQYADLCHPDDLESSDQTLEECFARKREHYECAKRMRHKNGNWIWIIDRGQVIEWSEDGKPQRMVGTHFDLTERKAAEEAMRERDTVMRTALDATGESIFVIDREGKVLALNTTAAARLKTTPSEVLNRCIFDFLPPHLVEWRRSQLEKAIQSEQPVLFEDERDGFWLDNAVYPVLDDCGKVTKLVIFARDITEWKRAQASAARENRIAEARASLVQFAQDNPLQALLRETVDQACAITGSPIGFYHFLEEDQRTISLQVWSTATEREFCTADGSGLHYDYEKAGVWADCIREGRPVIHNDYAALPHRRGMPEGHAAVIRELVVPVFRGDKIVAILGVGNKPSDYAQEDVDTVYRLADLAWDIVGRKRAEEERRASEARLQKFFSLGLIGMTVSSTEKDWIAFNDYLCDMLGYPREELVHKSWAELTHPEDLGADVSQWNRVMAGEIDSYSLKKRYIRKDGTLLHALLSVSVVRKADGSVDYFLALVYDISDLIATQEALTRSNESYNSFISQSHEAIYRTDLVEPIDVSLPVEAQIDAIYANAYIGECNRAMAEMYGALSPEHLIGMRLAELHGDRQSPVNRAAIRWFIESGYRVEDNETEETTLSGARRWFLSNDVGIVEDGKLIRVWGTCVDITERRQAEEALRESKERYRALVETISDWIWEIDAEGRYTYVSPRVQDVLEYSPEELLGRTPFDFMPQAEAERVRTIYAQIALNRQPFFNLENVCLAKDGRWVVMETSGVPVLDSEGRWAGFRGVDRDITERKVAYQALREREEEQRAIIQTAQDGFWLTDLEGRLVEVNDAYCRMSGYSRGELLTMRITDLEAVESEEETAEHMRRLIAAGHDRFESRHRRKDGSEYDVEVSVHFRPESGGRVVCFLRDITSSKQAEAERLRLEEQLRQSQKLEAVGMLAGGVAHDFNNLLQVMMGYVQLAAGDLGKGHPLRQELREVVKAGERAKNLVNQLLTFSRRQILRPAALDLNDVIAGFLKMLHRVIGEHIRIDFVPGNGIGAIYADQGMIEQVLMNLCVNARDAMGSSGTLTLETRPALIDEEAMGTGGFAKAGSYAVLIVSDTGCGMDSETLARIFDPFFTTKEQGKGTGLGLSTVYGIVGQHNGVVQVQSEPGRGSTFTVYLPVVESSVEQAPEDAPSTPPKGTETILLAEDDESVRKLAMRILRDAGYTVVVATNGAEAIERFMENRESVRLLLLDVVMPVMGGREAYERICVLAPGIPALFASGYAEDALHADFTLPEGMDLLRKPYMPEDLLAKVRHALDAVTTEKG